jgi:HAD superfamily hydrolase (TIGR01509 family)
MIEAVTFDYWNTLCAEPARGYLRGRRVEAWLGLLEDAGFATERQGLDAAFASAWDVELARWTVGDHITYTEVAEHVLDVLGYDVPDDLRATLLDAFLAAGDEADLHLTPNVADAIATLKRAGVRIGIVCDVGFTPSTTLRRHLDRHGLLDSFDHWSFSDEVGRYKPDPVIFNHALAGLGADPATTAHVGDLRRTDVAGALAMGMTAVRYTGVFDDDSQPEPEAHHVLADHADLPAVLGVVPH